MSQLNQQLSDALQLDEPVETGQEDGMSAVDVTTDLHEANSILDETKRVEDIREGVIAMGQVAATLECSTLHHLALFQIAGNLATAGTGLSSDAIIPNLESYNGTSVSVESISQTAANLWKRVLEALKRAAEVFAKFWDSIYDSTAGMSRANRRLQARSKAMKGHSIDKPTIVLNTERRKLEINGQIPSNGAIVHKALVRLKSTLKAVLEGYTGSVLVGGAALVSAAQHTQLPADQYLQSHIDAANKIDIRSVAGLLGARDYTDSRFSPGEVMASPALIGNRTLFIYKGSTFNNNSSVLSQAEICRSRRIELGQTSTLQNNNGNEQVSINTFDAGVTYAISQEVAEILKMISTYAKGGRRQSLIKQKKALIDAVDSAQGSLYGNQTTESDSSHYRSASRFASAFSAWAENPHDALCTHALSVCRAAISACNKSMAAHR